MLTFATLSLPWYEAATSSRIGAIILQGPHHSAQKSTSTGSLDFSTSASKSSSLTCEISSLIVTPGQLEAGRIKGLAGAAPAYRLHCARFETGVAAAFPPASLAPLHQRHCRRGASTLQPGQRHTSRLPDPQHAGRTGIFQ